MPFAIPLSERATALLSHPASSAEAEQPDAAPPNIQAAIEAALDRGETHYTDRPGILRLRERIAALLRQRFAIPIDANNDVIVTCGVTEARFVATQQLLQPGDTFAAPVATDLFEGAALLRRAILSPFLAPQTSLVCLQSSAAVASLRSWLATVPSAARILFEIDEAENRFHPAQIPALANRTVTIGNLGDASWRIGYLASPGGPSTELRDFKQALTICSANLSQWAALAALEAL